MAEAPSLPAQVHGNARGMDLKNVHNTSQGENKMLKRGSIVLSIWCVINFILAFIILCYVIVLKKDSPILQVASFSEAEIASLGAKTIAALNCFYDPVQLLLTAHLGANVAAHPQKPGRRSKIGFLDVGVCDRLCGSDGIFRFLIYWAWSLAGECCSEHPIRGGHWFVFISHTQAQKSNCMI